MYDQAKIIEQAYGTYQDLIKQGKSAEASKFFQEEKAQISKYTLIENIKRQEGVISTQIKLIERSAIDPDLKKERIQKLRDAQNNLAKLVAPKS